MKKFVVPFASLIIVAAGLFSCSKVISKVFPGIDQDAPDITITLPAIPDLAANFPESQMGSYTQRFNLDSIIRAKTDNVFGVGDVHSAAVKQVMITAANADATSNLSAFQTARFSLTSNANSTPLDVASFAFPDKAYPDPATTTQTFVPTNPPDILSYLKGSEITSAVYGKVRRGTQKPLQVTIRLTFTFK